ncbi:ImmA/IrrE family metallo-endopeptidase [Thioalkalivibrio sp. HK1]|uniref:ImmA/IrrE family metallo-endopeptidase n=1 Tax=Thioalkalivibrio sp. HK1 TaxID=1469245 RepID=UPI00046EB475|nr:ImmA/IrrE family metallo-endopeptidase [Thioalkalivibrio sp. HK1]
MADSNTHIDSDWLSPPGDTISDASEERGWTRHELADRLGLDKRKIDRLIEGEIPLSEDIAFRLERVIGSTAAFWLRREAYYREGLERKRRAERLAEWTDWLDILPVKQLMECGAILKSRLVEKNKPAIVDGCLRFFGVASPDEWHRVYGSNGTTPGRYRRTSTGKSDSGAIAAWLRLGEIQAENWEGPDFDRTCFEEALTEIRRLTVVSPRTFVHSMRMSLKNAGVVLAFIPAIRGARVSGVARWLSPTRPLIQISLYGKWNDRFWFTFFHEAAHILLHGNSEKERNAIYLDDLGDGKNSLESAEEDEANRWAADFLIPPESANRLLELKTVDSIEEFSKELGIHPAVVVGRLQHEGIVPQNRMNGLKQRLTLMPSSHD